MAGYKKNLVAVEEHLDTGETIQQSCYGVFKIKMLGHDSANNGIFLVTEKRAMLFGKKLFGYDMESFPLSKVTAIEMSKGMWGKKITLKMSGNSAEMTIFEGDSDALVNYIREHMGEMAAPASAPSPAEDIPAQIQKLAALKDQGILTEEEFTAKKAELLAKM
jgi:hypothetical protein